MKLHINYFVGKTKNLKQIIFVCIFFDLNRFSRLFYSVLQDEVSCTFHSKQSSESFFYVIVPIKVAHSTNRTKSLQKRNK